MSLFASIKKKIIAPLYERDFEKWAQTCTDDELEKYINEKSTRKEIEYTKKFWGHTFEITNKTSKYIHLGADFHIGPFRLVILFCLKQLKAE